jgi:DNA-3-methyladenine glycosylase II
MPHVARPPHKAAQYLTQVCPRFAALIGRVGPPGLRVERGRGLYEALIRAIAHQQLHGKAAEAILARFVALYPNETFPSPDRVLDTDGTILRGCGFSAAKLAAVQDICAKTLDGTVPTRRLAMRLSDAELIERLTTIRGVGRWAAGRPAGRRFRRARGLPGAV